MELGYALAHGKLEDLGLDVLSVLSDGGATLQRILLDDRLILKIWYHYVHEHTQDDWDMALETLDTMPKGLQDFREDFYKLVVNFSPALSRNILTEMWDQAKREMRDLRKVRSLLSSSNSSEEQESTQDDTLSES